MTGKLSEINYSRPEPPVSWLRGVFFDSTEPDPGNAGGGSVFIHSFVFRYGGIFLWKNIHLFGMGSGKGFVGGVNNTSTSNSMNNDDNSLMSQQEITTVHIKPVEQITVSRNMYLYKNKEIELKELINELKSLNEIEIEINPEANVSPNAMDKLTKALDENNLKYKVIE